MFILLSSTWIGALSFIVFFGAVAIGIFLMWTEPGDRFKAYMKELFTPPPPPPKIDPHSRPRPQIVSCHDEKQIELEAPKLPSKQVSSQYEYIHPPFTKPCPFCGERITFSCKIIEDGNEWTNPWTDSYSYIRHILVYHQEKGKEDPYSIPCYCCAIYEYWSDDMVSGITTPNPYCKHCGGTGREPVIVNTTADGKKIVSCARVVLSGDDLLICPVCRNGPKGRLKCEVCGHAGALTRREIHELHYWAPGHRG